MSGDGTPVSPLISHLSSAVTETETVGGGFYTRRTYSPLMRFTRDRRGQSVVVGTVILFGFLILAMSMYQVQIVPQQNAQVEFQHFEEARNDMVNLRAGILQAGSSDATQYRTVQLGTTYSPRLFAINPPSPSGTIRTSESYPITITNGSDTRTIPTRFIEYRPGYHEIDQSPMWYDASVLYLDARDEGGGIAVIEDQNLVDSDSNEVQITALQNEFRRSGTGQVTLELYPAENVTETIPEGDLTVTVPTRLSGDEYWDDEANISSDVYVGTSDANEAGIHNLTLKTTNENLTVDTVGVQEAPEDPTQNGDAGSGPQCTFGTNINPNALQWSKLDNFKTIHSKDYWEIDVQVQDNDNDGDLSQVELQITDSNGIIRASQTYDTIPSAQWDPGTLTIDPNDPSYNVKQNIDYTITGTACDADGNTDTQSP